MNRRTFLLSGVGFAAAAAGGAALLRSPGHAAPAKGMYPVMKSESEWKAQLTPAQYSVLREEGTERAFSSPLNDEKRRGVFHCAACDQKLFSSETKFDSGTGWPSFYEALPQAVAYREDRKFFMVRTEEHCTNCGGHLGHVFDDGPPPTGKRHCINGVALVFRPASA